MPPIKTNKHRSAGVSVELSSVLGSGAGKIRKKIRDIERLLAKKRDVLPADMVLANERALETLKIELENAGQVQQVKKMAKKYHMVRFFEKKKALRKYNHAKKEHDELVEKGEKKEIKKARKRLGHAEVDLCYVCNFPKDRKYISLFPAQESKDVDDENLKKGLQKTEAMRSAFKKDIESMMKDNTLPISLQDILDGKAGDKTTLASNFESQKVEETALDEGEDEDDFFE